MFPRGNHDANAASGDQGPAGMVDPRRAESWPAAGGDSRRHGGKRARRGIEYTAPRSCAGVGCASELADAPGDRVVSQSPPANASGIAAPKINLLVTSGPAPADYVMPNLTGQPLGSATLALQDAGMRIGKVSMAPPAHAGRLASRACCAIGAQPGEPDRHANSSSGAKIVTGATVNLEVR